MTTAMLKTEKVAIAPRQPRSTILLGEDSILAPKAEFELGLREDDPSKARLVHLQQAAAETGAHELMSDAALAAVRRAERYSSSSLAWSQAGFACLAGGHFDQARDAFSHALNIEPTLRNARLGLARTWLQLRNYGEATSLLRTLLAEQPHDSEVLMSLAVVLADSGDPNEALQLLEAARFVSPSASFYATRGSLRLTLGNYPGAIGDLRKAINARPDWPHVRNVLGLAEFKLGRFAAAERHFREAARIAPLYQEPFLNLLRVLAAQSRFSEIITEVTRIYSPSNAPAAVGRIAGAASLEMGNWRNAITWLQCAIEKVSDKQVRARVLNDLGCAFSRLGDQITAGKHFESSVEAFPNELGIVNRAKVLLLDGQPLLAINWLTNAPGLAEPPSYGRMLVLARAFSAADMGAQAAEIARALIESPGADVDAYALLTTLLVDDLANPNEAVEVAVRGLAIFPRDATLVNNLAYGLLMADRVDEAEDVLKGDLNNITRVDEVVLRATRGLLALKRGDIVGGRQLYEEALRNAEGENMRARLRAKRDLEVGRALVRSGRIDEGISLFARASGERNAGVYNLHAKLELKRLRK